MLRWSLTILIGLLLAAGAAWLWLAGSGDDEANPKSAEPVPVVEMPWVGGAKVNVGLFVGTFRMQGDPDCLHPVVTRIEPTSTGEIPRLRVSIAGKEDGVVQDWTGLFDWQIAQSQLSAEEATASLKLVGGPLTLSLRRADVTGTPPGTLPLEARWADNPVGEVWSRCITVDAATSSVTPGDR